MALHFSAAEMADRQRRLLEALAAQKLDGALLFAQESDYWLTGYDTFGFVSFNAFTSARTGARRC